MIFSLGISPCPNDTFMFDALLHQKIDTEDIEFNLVMEDVEALNNLALSSELDISKVSYHGFMYMTDQYQLLNTGSALGNGVGPILIANRDFDPSTIDRAKIGIPGKYTTANLLCTLAYPQIQNKQEMLFSEIEQALLENRIDAGVIIHENRFTYKERGLIKIKDLGDYWEQETKFPIPLGGIVIKRNIQEAQKLKIQKIIRRSVQYAFDHPEASSQFVKSHAQEIKDKVIKNHIDLYVTEFSKDLGHIGRKAISELIHACYRVKLISEIPTNIFL